MCAVQTHFLMNAISNAVLMCYAMSMKRRGTAVAHFHPSPIRWLKRASLVLVMTQAEAAMAENTALPAETADISAILSDYSQRIRDAVEPASVRRACNSLSGSYATHDTITVCGEALGQNRYRVPREVAVAAKEEDLKSPVNKGRALMKAGDSGPVGNTADLGGAGFNPLMFGFYGYKIVEKLIESAREE